MDEQIAQFDKEHRGSHNCDGVSLNPIWQDEQV